MMCMECFNCSTYGSNTVCFMCLLGFRMPTSLCIFVAAEALQLARPTGANQGTAGQKRPWSGSTRYGLRWKWSERRLVQCSTRQCVVAFVHSILQPSTKLDWPKRETSTVEQRYREPIWIWPLMRNGDKATAIQIRGEWQSCRWIKRRMTPYNLRMCVSVLFQCRITHTPFTLCIVNACRTVCGDGYEELCPSKVPLAAAYLDAHKYTQV